MILIKTALGQTALQNRSLALSPRQRSMFIMFDGKRTVDDVMKATAGLGATPEDVNHLVALGVLASLTSHVPPPAVLAPTPTAATAAAAAPTVGAHAAAPQAATLAFDANGQPTASAQARYSKAYPIAIRLTATLGLRGFRLNLAVEGAGDLDKLKELAPKIREAVGPEKFLELENALYY
ncbi:MAG: hypothetical protein EAZ34_10500 [Polaromonas sp.]|nr:MAG: hypothetical protein EAZ34_10500 [Polaromonas sp.]